MILFNRKYGSGAPMVLLHGLFGQSDNLSSVAKVLGEDFTVYTLDQRNHGQSPHDETFTYAAMVDDLRETLDDLQLDKVHLVGHSMGGKTAMLFAETYPERLLSLVVADIGPQYYPQHHTEILEGLNNLKIDSLQSRSEAEQLLAQDIPDVSTRQFLLKNLVRTEDNQFEWRFNLPVITREIEQVGQAQSRKVAVKTLFIKGGKSKYIRPEDETQIRSQYSNVTIKELPTSGHWLHAEDPEGFVKAVREFALSV